MLSFQDPRPMPRLSEALTVVAVGMLCATASLAHAAKCQVTKLAEIPVTMVGLRPTISAKINGKEAQFMLDSGAVFSMMSTATAAEYDLKLKSAPYGMAIMGMNGEADVKVATVQEFSLPGFVINKIEFLVGGSDTSLVGELGQNFLQQFDVEYDLASGVVRLFHTENCDDADLAYWLKPGQSYSIMPIDKTSAGSPHTAGMVYVNGTQFHAMLDTGAPTSVLSLAAAARLGVTPRSAGVLAAGYSGGFGRALSQSYIAPFASFKIGDGEEIHRAKLRLAPMSLTGTDMLLGADFFLSHRIFVANKQHRLYLSYNGGPVFDLSMRQPSETTAGSTELNPAPDQPERASGGTGGDAAEIARHGAALASRRDFVAAISELTKAIALSPNDSEFYFQRGNAYLESLQADLALQDFSHAITLKPDFLPAYMPRAELYFAKNDMAAGLADLDTVSRLAPQPADLRFMVAQLYQHLDHFPEAIAEYTLWIQYHDVDSRIVMAMQGRAVSSVMQNQDLTTALKDCDEALRRVGKADYPKIWADRGFVYLRRGEYRLAISDFGKAIDSSRKPAVALYGRSVAESRYGLKKESLADLALARQLEPKIGERYEKFGLAP